MGDFGWRVNSPLTNILLGGRRGFLGGGCRRMDGVFGGGEEKQISDSYYKN